MKIHLYTVWNPKHCSETMGKHLKVLQKEGLVKWLVLYDKKTEENFENIISESEIAKLNKQAEKSETVLYIQCLNIFLSPFYAGKIAKIERIERESQPLFQNDVCIPPYYKDALKPELMASFSITLSDLRVIPLDEILNLEPNPDFKSEKFNYPFPCIICQLDPRLIFEERESYSSILISYVSHEHKKGFVKEVDGAFQTNPITLGKIQIEFIKILKNLQYHDTKGLVKGLIAALKIYASSNKEFKIAPSLETGGPRKQKDYINKLKSRLDLKFLDKFQKPFIITDYDKYKLNVRNVKIESQP